VRSMDCSITLFIICSLNEFSKLRLKVQIATEHAKWNEWDLDSSLS
jgi:hypothetical protein